MAESTAVAVRRDGTITLKDGGGNSYDIAYENGDFSYTEEKADRIVIRDRGVIVGLRAGDDPVLSFSFTCHLRELTSAADPTTLDFIMDTGSFSGNTSVGGAGYEQYLIDIDFQIATTAAGGITDKATLSKCLLTYQISEGDPDSISLTGECYGGIVRADV